LEDAARQLEGLFGTTGNWTRQNFAI
jgi:hypothetical protein